MASKFETGHFKNLANFGTLINYLGTQPTYMPDEVSIQLASLDAQRAEIEMATTNLVAHAAELQVSINTRQQQFAQMRKFATRLMRYLEAIGVDTDTLNDVKTHYKNLSTKKLGRVEKIGEDGSVSEKTYSSSRLSYESMAENFQKMVARIASISNYAPNEQAIQINNLNAQYEQLHNTNEQVNAQFQLVYNTRNLRDQLMYSKGSGLYDIVMRIKKYLQFKYGLQSDQVKYANTLTFTRKQIRIQGQLPNI